jgi:dihydroorotate dehydrogenase electron transfer subunit
MLAAKKAGQSLDVIGPLGRGFQLPEEECLAAIVAGGIGIAPVPFLVQALVARHARVVLFVGAQDDSRTPFLVRRSNGVLPATEGQPYLPGLDNDLVAQLSSDLRGLDLGGAEVTFASQSANGILVSELLAGRLRELSAGRAKVFAIGPYAMLKRVAQIVKGHLSLQVSLEERMACGVGACRSCVVPVIADGGVSYRTVCRDGPVFYASDIAWDHLEA